MSSSTLLPPDHSPESPPHGATPSTGQRTKQRLLDAAERLFADRGFEGASMRAVTQAAGTSVSAANYHFGSKQALLRAVLQRRIEPVNRERIRQLDVIECEARNEGRPVELEEVLQAFLRPSFAHRARAPEARWEMRQVAARLYTDPPELVAALKRELFSEIAERFVAALEAALPERARNEIALAFQFTIGVMVHVMAGHLDGAPTLEFAEATDREAYSDDVILDSMIAFASAGLRAQTSQTRAPRGVPT